MKILIAADGSPYTKRMLAYVAAHDEWLGPQHECTVLHAETPLPNNAAHVLGREVCDGYYRDQAAQVIEPVRKFFEQQGLKATYLSKIGSIASTIAETAEQGRFDVLMMGSHGHGALASMVMGSVTSKVLGLCKVPVLIIR